MWVDQVQSRGGRSHMRKQQHKESMEEKKVDTGEALKLHIAKHEESECSQKSFGSRAQEGRWSSVLLRRRRRRKRREKNRGSDLPSYSFLCLCWPRAAVGLINNKSQLKTRTTRLNHPFLPHSSQPSNKIIRD